MQKDLQTLMFAAILVLSFSTYFACGLLPGKACCSLAPARFSKTKGWVGEAKMDGKLVHVLAYGNSVQNLIQNPFASPGNAMLLPIPAAPGSMSDQNLLDMSKGTHVLADMESSLPALSQGPATFGFAPRKAAMPMIQVFEHGIYTVVLAQHAGDIPAALVRVPAQKRPAINAAMFSAYERWYPGWTFALCCFNNKDEKMAEPLLWWYQPQYPKILFFPALDCHTGEVPKLNEMVDVDHFIAASSPELDKLSIIDLAMRGRVKYSDTNLPNSIKTLLPKNIVGTTLHEKLSNGDFLISLKDVRAGRFNIRRVLPPGANFANDLPKFKDLADSAKF